MKAKPDKHHHHHHQKTHEDKQEDRRLGNPAGGGVDEQQEKISQVKVVVSILHGVPYRNGKGSLYKKENIWERGRLRENTASQLPHTANRTQPIFTVPSHSPSALPQTSKKELTIYLLMSHLFPKCIKAVEHKRQVRFHC